MIPKHTWYLTTTRMRAVPQDDPDAYFLFVRAGDEIDDAMAEKYDLPALEAHMAASTKAVEAAPENKAVIMPPKVKQKPRLVKRAKQK